MRFSLPPRYRKKSLITELMYLFILSFGIPFTMGSQIWTSYSYTFSLILVTTLTLPAVILFYRWLLPFTIGRKRYGLFILCLPVFLVVYEINSRLASIIGMSLPFIPKGYRQNLASAHPQDFSVHYINQTVGYTCLVLLSATSLYMAREIYKSQNRLYAVETDKLRLELNQLKSQLQPHFFFNTLNNLYSLSTQQSPKTSAMIADLSAIMHYVLYESQHEKVVLEKEVQFIRSYIELERLRHDDGNIIDFDVQGDTGSMQIEPLLFLPVIENAFKHSLAKNIPGKYARIVLAVDEDELIFQVTNPCAAPGADLPVTATGGIGLQNMKKRLELLYAGRYQLDIDRHDGIFTVFLTIRLYNKK